MKKNIAGFTMIEVIVTTSLSMIIFLIINTLTTGYIKLYKHIQIDYQDSQDVEAIFLTIDKLVNEANLGNTNLTIHKKITNEISNNNTNQITLETLQTTYILLSNNRIVKGIYNNTYVQNYEKIQRISITEREKIIEVIIESVNGTYQRNYFLIGK